MGNDVRIYLTEERKNRYYLYGGGIHSDCLDKKMPYGYLVKK